MRLHLVSDRDQTVRIGDLDLDVELSAGETIHTEDCHKYDRAEIDEVASQAGLAVEQHWLDERQRFSLNLLRLA